MFDLTPISREAIPEALSKAERYRLLNEPWQAESICLDILHVEPGHQQALVLLLLSLTDQFGKGVSTARAREVLTHLHGDYERAYYGGIVHERWAESLLRQDSPAAGFTPYPTLRVPPPPPPAVPSTRCPAVPAKFGGSFFCPVKITAPGFGPPRAAPKRPGTAPPPPGPSP